MDKKGDPYLDQAMRSVEYIKNHFTETHVTYGFQNHDELPFIKWTTPNDDKALADLAKRPCSKVLSSGQISFTVDSLETLYDHAIGEREYLQKQATKVGLKKDCVLSGENFSELIFRKEHFWWLLFARFARSINPSENDRYQMV